MTASAIDWTAWLRRWDTQQERYLPDREQRFAIILDALDMLVPQPFVALDLACGPGSISQRLLARFPQAQTIAIDYNPVLLRLGQEALGTIDGRLHWLSANLLEGGWTDRIAAQVHDLGRTHVDAVLTTTALHYLPAPALVDTYAQVAPLIRPGGLLLNGDHMAFPPGQPTARQLAGEAKRRQYEQAFGRAGGEDYRGWWAAIEADLVAHDPALLALFEQHRANEAQRRRDFSEPIVAVHEAALLDAGFAEVSTIWQAFDNRVLLAVRGLPTEPIHT
jgi:SAM-dependent methyltransferase